MQISGKVTRRETRTGSMPDKDAPRDAPREITWDFDVLTVQTEFDSIEVRVSGQQRSQVEGIHRGSHVTLEVDPPKDKFRLVEVVKSPAAAVRSAS